MIVLDWHWHWLLLVIWLDAADYIMCVVEFCWGDGWMVLLWLRSRLIMSQSQQYNIGSLTFCVAKYQLWRLISNNIILDASTIGDQEWNVVIYCSISKKVNVIRWKFNCVSIITKFCDSNSDIVERNTIILGLRVNNFGVSILIFEIKNICQDSKNKSWTQK